MTNHVNVGKRQRAAIALSLTALMVGGSLSAPLVATAATAEKAPTTLAALAAGEEVGITSISLANWADGSKKLPWEGGRVTGVISYDGLTPGLRYDLTIDLCNVSLTECHGLPVAISFQPTSPNGTETFAVDEITSDAAGLDLIASAMISESTTSWSQEFFNPSEFVSVEQRPAPAAELSGETNITGGGKTLPHTGGVLVNETRYANLSTDETYTLNVYLFDTKDIKNTAIKKVTEFTPEAPTGYIASELTVPSGNDGRNLVAFAELLLDGRIVAEYKNVGDSAHTITVEEVPVVITLDGALVSESNGSKAVKWDGESVINTVSYTNLKPGLYNIRTVLYDKATGEATNIESGVGFHSTGVPASVEMRYTIPFGYAGQTLVARSYLYEGQDNTGPVIASLDDLNDASQTVKVDTEPVTTPGIGGSIKDEASGSNTISWVGGRAINSVSYFNLEAGEEYTIVGHLVDKVTGEAVGGESGITFTPKESSGVLDISFDVPSDLSGHTLVSFVRLWAGATTNGEPLFVLEDLDDPSQTITVADEPEAEPDAPLLGGSLVNAEDGGHALASSGGKVTSTITYRNLKIGTEYSIFAHLVNKLTNEATNIRWGVTFNADAADGTTKMTFDMPEGYEGTTLVTFLALHEGATADSPLIARFEDINDAAQTIVVANEDDTLPVTPVDPTPTEPGAGSGNGADADSGAADGEPAAVADKKADALAVTGGTISIAALGGALLAMMIGAALLIRRRRSLAMEDGE